MPSDLHHGFPDPATVDGHDVAEFLLAADRLPGVRRVRRAMRARTVVATGGILEDLGADRAGRPRGWPLDPPEHG